MLLKIDSGKKKVFTLSMMFGMVALFTCGCGIGSMGMTQEIKNIWNFGEYGQETGTKNSYEERMGEEVPADSYSYYSDQEFSFRLKRGKEKGIYNAEYQEAAKEMLEFIKREREYTVDSPLFILNPFGTNVTGLYVYMGPNKKHAQVSYTVSVQDEGIPDFYGTMYLGGAKEDALEGQVIGMIPGMKNKLVLTVMTPDGTIVSKKAYYFNVPSYSPAFSSVLNSKSAQDAVLTRGFYILSAMDGKTTYFLFYDNYGILRAQIPTEVTTYQTKLLQTDNHLFFAASDHMFVLLNYLGYMTAEYATGSEECRDYVYDNKKKCVLILLKENGSQSVARLKKLDLTTKEMTDLADFEELLADLKERTGEEAVQNTDWLSLSSIVLVDNHDIVASARSISMIIRVNNVYTNPVIRWMIGPEQMVEETEYESLMLTKKGSFFTQAGQDAVYYAKEKKAREGQYYLSFFNHNYSERATRTELSTDMENEIETDKKEEKHSYFYCYAVEEMQNQYRLIVKIPLPYVVEQCTALPYGKHFIISIGKEKTFMEYDNKGELISQFLLPNIEFSYKVYKSTMDRYWF